MPRERRDRTGGPMILGNVFESGKPGVLCQLELLAGSIRAVARQEPHSIFDFPLEAARVEFGGDAGSQVIVKNRHGQILYAERSQLEGWLSNSPDPALQARIQGELGRVKRAHRLAHLGLVGFLLGILLLLALTVPILNWCVDRVVDGIPVSWEKTLGSAVVASLGEAEIRDPQVVQPVQAVLDRLVKASGEQPYQFHLTIARSDQVNAFAAPGGSIVVNSGLLLKTSRPEELAGVLGHELQHVLGRHGLRNMVHSLKWSLLAALFVGDVGTVQKALMVQAPQFLSLSYGRSLEQEADEEGTRLLIRAGIDPSGLKDFFGILQREESQRGLAPPEILSSHPDTQHRIENLERYLQAHPTRFPPLDLPWDDMLKALKTSS